jgi:hypothetical protein
MEGLIVNLATTLRISSECIASEISRLGVRYKQKRQAENTGRHLSKLRRDLAKGCLRLQKVKKALATGNKRSFVTWRKSALEWIDGLSGDSKEALGISGNPKHDTVLGSAYDAILTININDVTYDPEIASKLQNAIDFVEEVAANNLPIGNRLSRARREFLGGLAQLYHDATGHRPTFKRGVSSFYGFASDALKIYDPNSSNAGEHDAWASEDILTAVNRHRERKESDGLTMLGSYQDPRIKKRARRPT